MNSRLETLVNKLKIEDRFFSNKITDEMLSIDFERIDKIIVEEKKISYDFISHNLVNEVENEYKKN